MVFLAVLSSFGFGFFALFSVLSSSQDKTQAQERILRALGRVELEMEEETLSLRERLWQPLLHYAAARLARLAPQGQRNRIAAKLSVAGLAGHWESVEWQGLEYGLGFLMALFFFVGATFLHIALIWRFEMVVSGFLFGYLFPGFWLKAQTRQRVREIQNTLPDVLDLLTISVEAGLGFDAALLKVIEKQKGALAEEFLKVLQEIKMGRPRRDALRDLGKRNQVEDLSNVVASLVQADQLGISIGGVLRNQAQQIRLKRRQRAEEKAQKAPIKMMVPLVFFVFPSIFIIVLGPALIQIADMFAQH
ncbi:MAG: type II secretion system F family protein [Desulfitobacteriaceae bacterium]